MIQRITAIFRDGAFVPEQAVELPDGTTVSVYVNTPTATTSPELDRDQKRRMLSDLVHRMQQRSSALTAPLPTRDELHERR